MNQNATNPKVIYIVVGAIALMALTYVGTLAFCLIRGITPQGDLVRSFEAAGIYVLGSLTGLLINTRTAPPSTTTESTTTTTTTAKVEPDSSPDAKMVITQQPEVAISGEPQTDERK